MMKQLPVHFCDELGLRKPKKNIYGHELMITPRTPQRCLRKAVYVYRTIVNASERNDSKIVRQTNTQSGVDT